MARQILALRLLSGTLVAVSVYELWARWSLAEPFAGYLAPASGATGVALAAALGFAVVANALRHLERERAANRERAA